MLAADLVVASTRSSFGLAEVKRNLVAGAGGLFRLPRAIGRAAAMEAILTGEPIPAERAYQLGLVSRLAEPGAALDEALRLAEQITLNAPLAVWESRRVVHAAAGGGDEADAAGDDRCGDERGGAVGRPRRRADRVHREAPAGVDRPLSAARPLSDPRAPAASGAIVSKMRLEPGFHTCTPSQR